MHDQRVRGGDDDLILEKAKKKGQKMEDRKNQVRVNENIKACMLSA